jgi:hypothetical protein
MKPRKGGEVKTEMLETGYGIDKWPKRPPKDPRTLAEVEADMNAGDYGGRRKPLGWLK